MPSRQHETIIKSLVERYGFQTKTFRRTLHDAIYQDKLNDANERHPEEDAEKVVPESQIPQYRRRVAREEAEELIEGCRRTPDAFYINEKERTLVVIEVEHTNPLSDEAIADYVTLWWAFDSDDHWLFELFTVDRYNLCRHVSLWSIDQDGPRYTDSGDVNTLYANKSCP